MTSAAGFTFAEGDLARCKKARGVFRVVAIHPVRGETTVWGGDKGRLSMRTFQSSDLLPPRPGDTAPRMPEMAAPQRRAGSR